VSYPLYLVDAFEQRQIDEHDGRSVVAF